MQYLQVTCTSNKIEKVKQRTYSCHKYITNETDTVSYEFVRV